MDQDANDAVLDSYTSQGKADAEINFTNYTPQVVVDWVNKGYEVVNAKNDNDSAIAASLTGTDPAKWKFGNFDNNQKIVQAFTITLKHKHTTFNPQNPGQPNEPLNPKDPTGPKVTQAMLDYQETYTATVHYEGAGKDTPVDNVQRSTWTRSITVDNVTGGILNTTPWVSTDSYKNVPTPVVQSYHANKANVPAPKNERKDIINYVLYAPNGAIVPVDPDGNPILGVKHPVFPTDPTNPTKPAVGKVPTAPDGWLPTKPNEKPGDLISPDPQNPSADVKVPFHKQETPPPVITEQKAQVQYIDLDEHDKIMSQSPILTGKSGAKIDYSTAKSIKTYEDQGYVLVNDGFF
ncbi:LPXTG-motif cell wall anchor domain protein [Lactobacillus kefiranofaciens subsp. kefiranofaciens DSM 5016 = JCM 6985]|uniref:mucin-binding protein n=1 Tax=Lactobacillus kefiranofaciens TaxID=267818 RepID=UPI0006EF6329|nr:hypothetical protein [Lactobacillus kefiranofaciens]KRM21928.1 LPXTG-motif cell wall anchor domain protein [Lactobacillus kefiranofaciens subsp. kefiranofaciens DSM 5016 = JCM 6985]